MREIGIGIVGGGYMGKAHSVAMAAVGAVFDTALRPRLEMICATTPHRPNATAPPTVPPRHRRLAPSGGRPGRRGGGDRQPPGNPPRHRRGRLCLGQSPSCAKSRWGQALTTTPRHDRRGRSLGRGEHGGLQLHPHPRQPVRPALIAGGEIGEITWFRGEHTEDSTPTAPPRATWRNFGRANGTMGDLAPHMVNAALALAGPIARLSADIGTVHANRPGPKAARRTTTSASSSAACQRRHGASDVQPRGPGAQDGLCL